MSNIVGTYVNPTLNSKLTIATANDSNGAITGTLSLGGLDMPLTGTWNASTVAPNGILCFTAGTQAHISTVVGGAAQTADFNVFSSISLGYTVVQKNTQAFCVSGTFTRA